jgi:uncharacterized repeat protein (TIGR03806 family)
MRLRVQARSAVGWLGLGVVVLGCSTSEPELGDPPYELLSDYGFFEGDLADQQPAEHVVGYQVAAPLWADHARKGRFVVLPAGETMTPAEQDEWSFPLGTTFIKTFYFDLDRRDPEGEARLVETRLLVNEPDAWQSYIYVWDDAQEEAVREVAGVDVDIEYVAEDGSTATQRYIVPDQLTCESCHLRDDVVVVLGPITQQLNMDVAVDGGTQNQLDLFAELGLLATPLDPATLPSFALPEDESAEIDARARGYLHGNCAHCHRPGGGGGPSGLSFLAWEDNPATYGVCKIPAAAGGGAGGRSHDIVPGDPDASIVPFRMATTDPEIKMPELPSLLADDFGVDLISEWITAMPANDCE